jgi:hypothetical protein
MPVTIPDVYLKYEKCLEITNRSRLKLNLACAVVFHAESITDRSLAVQPFSKKK